MNAAQRIATQPGVDDLVSAWRDAHHKAAVARSRANTARLFAEGCEERWIEALVYACDAEHEHASRAYEQALGWHDRALARVQELEAAERAAREALIGC